MPVPFGPLKYSLGSRCFVHIMCTNEKDANKKEWKWRGWVASGEGAQQPEGLQTTHRNAFVVVSIEVPLHFHFILCVIWLWMIIFGCIASLFWANNSLKWNNIYYTIYIISFWYIFTRPRDCRDMMKGGQDYISENNAGDDEIGSTNFPKGTDKIILEVEAW